jgi:hypothetical protein
VGSKLIFVSMKAEGHVWGWGLFSSRKVTPTKTFNKARGVTGLDRGTLHSLRHTVFISGTANNGVRSIW